MFCKTSLNILKYRSELWSVTKEIISVLGALKCHQLYCDMYKLKLYIVNDLYLAYCFSKVLLTCFPQAFHPDATPYPQINFHPKVKAAAAENKTGRVG